MATVRILPPAQQALRRHRNVAAKVLAKIEAYAADPAAQANNVKRLQGRPEMRLRVGDFRVLFIIEGDDMLVIDIAPRGNVYE